MLMLETMKVANLLINITQASGKRGAFIMAVYGISKVSGREVLIVQD